MNKFLKKAISVIAAVAVSAATLLGTPLSEFKGLAAEVSAVEIDEAYVQGKLAELKAAFSQTGTYKYFTSDGQYCCNNKLCDSSDESCPNKKCQLIASVLKKNPFAKSSGVGSIITKNDRYSCYAFASFAFAYIFGVDTYGNIGSGANQVAKTTYKIADSESIYSTLKPGDMLMYHNYNKEGKVIDTHYVIFLGYDSSTKTVRYYECNYNAGWKDKGGCLVEYDNKRKFDFYITRTNGVKRSYVTVYHYNGYGGEITPPPPSGEHYIVDKNYSGSDPKNIRASRSSSSALLGTIPKNTICWVTEITGSGSNKWGKVTYNGVTGYINLYYSVTTNDHGYGSWTIAKDASCTETGTKKRVCGCGNEQVETIPAKGHSYSGNKCTVCGHINNDGEHYIVDKNYSGSDPKNIRASKSTGSALLGTIPKNTVCWLTEISGSGSNKWGKVTYNGVTGYINLYYSVTTDDHQWSGWTVSEAAACTDPGTEKRSCGCGKIEEKTIAATGHNYGAWQTVTGATCTEDGAEQHTCSKCGNKETRAIAAAGHSYKDMVTAPTCTKEGYTTHTCTKCNNSYTDNKTAATGHSYKDVVTAPTCTEEGYTTHTCTKCGSSYTDNKTAATGHSYEEEIVAPTPTAGGYVKHTCTKCGQSYNDSYTSVLADVNNDKSVNAIDAKWILQYVSGSRSFTAEQMTVADVNGDGQVNAVDAKWILQIASGSRKLAGDTPKAIHNKARVFVTNL